MSAETQRSALDILLGMNAPQPETGTVHMKQLSEAAGTDVYFSIQALGYDRVREIQRMESGERGNFAVAVILAGVNEPNLRDERLLEKYDVPTSYELIPKLLTAGEIDELSARIEQLSGYRRSVTEMVKTLKKK